LDWALARGDTELIPALEMAVKEASLRREDAVAKYKYHQATHGANESGASA
jgi:hypothetical protein